MFGKFDSRESLMSLMSRFTVEDAPEERFGGNDVADAVQLRAAANAEGEGRGGVRSALRRRFVSPVATEAPDGRSVLTGRERVELVKEQLAQQEIQGSASQSNSSQGGGNRARMERVGASVMFFLGTPFYTGGYTIANTVGAGQPTVEALRSLYKKPEKFFCALEPCAWRMAIIAGVRLASNGHEGSDASVAVAAAKATLFETMLTGPTERKEMHAAVKAMQGRPVPGVAANFIAVMMGLGLRNGFGNYAAADAVLGDRKKDVKKDFALGAAAGAFGGVVHALTAQVASDLHKPTDVVPIAKNVLGDPRRVLGVAFAKSIVVGGMNVATATGAKLGGKVGGAIDERYR